MARNPYEEQRRAEKVQRYVAQFNATVTGDPNTSPTAEQAQEVLRILDASVDAQWELLRDNLKEKRVASPETRALIRAHYALIANKLYQTDPESPTDDARYEVEGDVRGVPYKVAAVLKAGDRGIGWSVYARDEFIRSGFTRSVDVLKAFAEARAVVEAHVAHDPAACIDCGGDAGPLESDR